MSTYFFTYKCLLYRYNQSFQLLRSTYFVISLYVKCYIVNQLKIKANYNAYNYTLSDEKN